MKEQYYDELLNIETIKEQAGFHKSFHYHRYEPTPYSALELLFENYKLTSNDRVVDFGCGKGRLNFFINYLFDATVIGIEMDEDFYEDAIENRACYLENFKSSEDRIQFYRCLAQEYEIKPEENRFYFFNPFSIQIFMRIINNILRSFEEHPREIELVLYYVSDEYIYFLENQTSFELKKEVRLPGLYEHNSDERFLIYRLAYE